MYFYIPETQVALKSSISSFNNVSNLSGLGFIIWCLEYLGSSIVK